MICDSEVVYKLKQKAKTTYTGQMDITAPQVQELINSSMVVCLITHCTV